MVGAKCPPSVALRGYLLDPAARAHGVSSCEMCHRHLAELPAPAYERA